MKNAKKFITSYQPKYADSFLRSLAIHKNLLSLTVNRSVMNNNSSFLHTYLCRLLLLGLVYCMSTYYLVAQCPTGDVTFSSQQEVNNFAINFPDCTIINGTLRIAGSDISSLSPLANLTQIVGGFFIQNSSLNNLNGLSALTRIGGRVYISDNLSLESMDGLSALTQIGGDCQIRYNNSLKNLDGFSSLTQIVGIFEIVQNPSLSTIEGLSAMTQVGGLIIQINSSLTNVDGLSALTQISGSCTVFDTPLTNLDGLSGLTYVGGNFVIGQISSLTDLDGLASLTQVGGSFSLSRLSSLPNLNGLSALTQVGGLVMSENDILLNLDGLTSLTQVGGDVLIDGNNSLTNINGLPVLVRIEKSLRISNNPVLTDLNGLITLTEVGVSLNINSNDILLNLDGLSSLTYVGGALSINANNALENVDGLHALTHVGDRMKVTDNNYLKDINGLSSLTEVEGDLEIGSNSVLANIDGLSAVVKVGRRLLIYSNPLITNLDGLSFLTQVENAIFIVDNSRLANMDGLCPLFRAGYSGSLDQQANAVVFNPDDCACIVENIGVGDQTACDPWLNTYAQTLEITYDGAPSTGQLNVNGQLFPIEASPQTIILQNLAADGQPVNVTAFFTDDAACIIEASALFTAPVDCSTPCDILSVTAGDRYDCNSNDDTYKRDLTVEYEGTNFTGNFMVSLDGGAPISYPILSQSPQVLTLTDLPSNGQEVDIDIYMSDENNCGWSADNLFQNPQSCGDNLGGDCDISSIIEGKQFCNYENGTYDQDIFIQYTNAPSSGSILVKANNESGWRTFPILANPQLIVLTDMTPGEGSVDLFIKFSDDNGCTFYAEDFFTAPEACVLPCAITSIATGSQTACDPNTNTYSQELLVMYENEPDGGSLVVGGQIFGITGSPQLVTLTNLPADRNSVNVTAYFSENNECQLEERELFVAPEPCSTSPSGDGAILFVVKDANNLQSGDAAVKSQLENTGYTVEVKSENVAKSSDANGKALVLISNTVSSGAINTKFTNVEVPVVTYESQLLDDLGMTGSNNGLDYGQDSNELTIDIDNPGHQMVGGLSGEPQIFSSNGNVIWGNPNSNAIKVVSTQGNYSGQWAVFGYETGSTMVNGTAPARRASLFFKASQVSKLNANGWSLFDAVICWATGCQSARFAPAVNQVPSVKAYPNPFQNNLTIEWDNHAQEVQLTLRNLLGQEVFSRKVMLQGRYQLSTGSLSEGMYILQVIGNDFKQEVKVVKE